MNKLSHWGRAQDEDEGYPHPMNLDQLRESPRGWGHQTVELIEMVLGAHLLVASTASVYSVIYSEEVEGSSRSSSSHVCTCHTNTHIHTQTHTPSVKTTGGLDRVGAGVHR